MRTVSAARNRSALVIVGLLALAAGAWIVIASTGAAADLPGWGSVLAEPGSTPAELATAHRAWALPVGIALALIAAILGLVLVIAQVPASPRASVFRISAPEGTDLGGIEPGVLARALAERAEGLTGVQDVGVQVLGAASATLVRADATVSEDAELAWVTAALRTRLAEDCAVSLGRAPDRLDLLIHLRGRARHEQRVDVAPAA